MPLANCFIVIRTCLHVFTSFLKVFVFFFLLFFFCKTNIRNDRVFYYIFVLSNFDITKNIELKMFWFVIFGNSWISIDWKKNIKQKKRPYVVNNNNNLGSSILSEKVFSIKNIFKKLEKKIFMCEKLNSFLIFNQQYRLTIIFLLRICLLRIHNNTIYCNNS